MDIQSGYYEAGIVLFWLLFAYLFMDKFLFRGGLGEICFGKMRRRMAKMSAEHCRMVRSDKRRTEERTQAYERKNGKERSSGSGSTGS